MQVHGLPRYVIRGAVLASRVAAKSSSNEAARRDALVARWRQAMAKGLSAEDAAAAVDVPRSTLYRWRKRSEPHSRRPHRKRPRSWTRALIAAVEALRADYPMWGKAKLGPLLRAEGFTVSDATIGRILQSLVARGRVTPAPSLRRRPRSHRWSPRRRHAVRLPKHLKPDRPGGLVQVDTLFVNIAPNKAIKHFTAYCPVAKWTVGKAANRATAKAATLFLDKLIADMPFTVEAIQVDGGSEFKAEFEQACAERGIHLYELPPKRPQLNGAVERCNGAWRHEFYNTYQLPASVEALNPILDSFQHLYNHHRPHGALAGQTPAAYLAKRRAAEAPASHMS
jgi:putative transposase